METKIVNLNSLDEQDENYMEFLDDLKNDNASAIYIVEKNNGEVFVGCNYEQRKDLVYAIYRLQMLAQTLIEKGE